MVDNGVTGLLFSPGHVGGLVQHMRMLLEHGDLRSSYGAADVEKFNQQYSEEVVIQKYIDLWRRASIQEKEGDQL